MRVLGFRALCSAQLATNIAIWMHTVGVQWLLISNNSSTSVLAAVQTATTLPFFLFALPAGVVADAMDRRRLLVVVQFAAALLSILLAASSAASATGDAELLAITVLIGTANAAGTVAWQSLIPELVERRLVPDAATLDGMSFNVGRIAGPALGGLLLAVVAPSFLFGLDAVVFIASGLAFWHWAPRHLHRERVHRFGAELRAGIRYAVHSPSTRRLLVRVILWSLPASAIWALLPAVSRDRLHLTSSGYGALFAALGLGAVIGGVILQPLRARLTSNQIVLACSLTYGAAIAVLGYTKMVAVIAVALALAGASWITVIAVFMGLAQSFLPAWVRARGLAIVLLVHQGCQAFGALLWGLLGTALGLPMALGIAAAALGLAGVSALMVGLYPIDLVDNEPVSLWPSVAPEPPEFVAGAPLLVRVEYHVEGLRLDPFLRAISLLGQARRRVGARRWLVTTEPSDETIRVVETFRVATWQDHIEQESQRWTLSDKAALDAVQALALQPPTIRRDYQRRSLVDHQHKELD
jgi:predicted MFS family arabinose efflux permease